MTQERLFGWRHAFDHPVTWWITVGIVALLAAAFTTIALLSATGRVQGKLRKELWIRTISWGVMAPLVVAPILLGAAWTMGMVLLLSLACYSEYARATGLFREKLTSFVTALGILLVSFAVFDHWYDFFVALFPLCVALIAASAVLLDRPHGYLQRVALGVLGFMLFGSALGHLGYMANDKNYRPIILLVLLGVQLNDVFAFVVGKTLGRRKWVPNTSPGKTAEGHLGALVLTTPLVATIGHFVFAGTALDRPLLLALFGVTLSISGQLGDLMLSSIKRDLGLKDMGSTIPGHGGILDRVNSVLLAAPAAFHYVGYFVGFGLDQPARIISGS